MRVCDLCKETSLEEKKVWIFFRAVSKDAKGFICVEDGELSELTCDKEICPDCCKKLLKLFKKGGDTK